MDNLPLLDQIKSIKARIEKLIEDGYLEEAKGLLEQIGANVPGDVDVCSMLAVIHIMEGRLNEAEIVLETGLSKDTVHFDLLFNLAYISELRGAYQNAADLYSKAATAAFSNMQIQNVEQAIERLKTVNAEILIKDKARIVFFVKKGMDSFLGDIINGLDEEYWTRKIIVDDFKQIDIGMEWADICWFEWCDELIVYGSRLPMARRKKTVCRLHRYEVFTETPQKVIWENVNMLIIVASHLKNFLINTVPNIGKKVKIVTICNGVNLSKYTFLSRSKGFNIAYIGYIHSRKNPVLLLQIIKKLVSIDKRYKLYIAGQFQEPLIEMYWNYQIEQMDLSNNVVFEGWQTKIERWLEDKNYLISTSIHESFGYGIAESMARGIKPVIHDFLFARDIWSGKYLFSSIDDAIEMILNDDYHSDEYSDFIKNNYSLDEKILEIKKILDTLSLNKFNRSTNTELNLSFENSNASVKFSPYGVNYINCYDFASSRIIIGKKELIDSSRETIEFILLNDHGKRLVITDIIHDYINNKVSLPDYINKSCNSNNILEYCKVILQYHELRYNSRGIAGFVFDDELIKDINENKIAYLWERGIPATEFMPDEGFLNIIRRYELATNYIKENDTVLDAASGFGYGSAYLSSKCKCKSIKALDIAKENISFGKSAYDFEKIEWTVGDVSKLPFASNHFDTYISFETLEHLPLPLVDSYLCEAARVLKKDGSFLISTPNKTARNNINNPFHIKEYTFDELDSLLQRYFQEIEYFSVINHEYEKGISNSSVNIIAVCRNRLFSCY